MKEKKGKKRKMNSFVLNQMGSDTLAVSFFNETPSIDNKKINKK